MVNHTFFEESNNDVLDGMRLRSVIEKIYYANLQKKIADQGYKLILEE